MRFDEWLNMKLPPQRQKPIRANYFVRKYGGTEAQKAMYTAAKRLEAAIRSWGVA
jgi:hypothetical protein